MKDKWCQKKVTETWWKYVTNDREMVFIKGLKKGRNVLNGMGCKGARNFHIP